MGLAALALTLLGAGSVRAQDALTLCYENVDVRPWRTVDGQGLNFELLRETARRVGLKLEFQALPWKRCLAQLQAGEVQGAFAASFAQDRLEVGAYPGGRQPDAAKRMHVDRYVLVRRRGDAVGWDGRSFQKLDGPVGSQLGYSIGAQLRGMGVTVDEGSQSARALVQKLLAGRLAAAALGGSDAAGLMAQDAQLAAQVEVLPVPLVEKPYFLMLSHNLVKSRPELTSRLWATLEEVRQSPAYRKLEKDAIEHGPRQ